MKVINQIKSNDNMAVKFLQKTTDGFVIETSFVDYYNKYIICYSTQIGCNKGCRFCASGLANKFVRNLSYNELFDQITNIIKSKIKDNYSKQILFSAMGVGEPLSNYDNLILLMNELNRLYPNSKCALATCGLDRDKIIKLADDTKELNFKLTVSLHSASEIIRKNIMPISNNLNDLIDKIELYQLQSNKEVEYNITLINGINDSKEDALLVTKLLKNRGIPEKTTIKINRFNNISQSTWTTSLHITEFIDVLTDNGLKVEYYETNGSDINGACGQLIYYK